MAKRQAKSAAKETEKPIEAAPTEKLSVNVKELVTYKEEKPFDSSELLKAVNGFESKVSELHYLQLKVKENSENAILNRSYKEKMLEVVSQLQLINSTVI